MLYQVHRALALLKNKSKILKTSLHQNLKFKDQIAKQKK